ncbi:hypothetical protein ABIB62_002322 [Mucilaginibacter sp. UYP25]|uniref:hypothetical protein n=1 Tax=unclassified Mucilaginibacter TaxID=2617802 RepID=UPI00339A22BD
MINTYIAHREAANRTALLTHVTAADPLTILRQQAFIRNFMAHGSTYFRAVQQSLGALENTVVRQTFLLSYMDAFLLLGILNACCIPLVLIMIKKRKEMKTVKIELPDAH